MDINTITFYESFAATSFAVEKATIKKKGVNIKRVGMDFFAIASIWNLRMAKFAQ